MQKNKVYYVPFMAEMHYFRPWHSVLT